MNPRQVLPNEPLSIQAETWNRLVRLVGPASTELSGPSESELRPAVTVLVRNDTGADLPARSVVKLNTALVDPVTFPFEFQAEPLYTGTTPGLSTDSFAVLVEPVRSLEIGRAAVLGVVVTDVNINSAGHIYAAPGTVNTRLESVGSGPVKIITRESGSSGVKRATVLIGLAPTRMEIGKLDGTLSFGGSQTVSLWHDNGSGTDADTGVNETGYDWLLSTGQTIASGKQVVIAYVGGRWRVIGAQCA